MKISEVSVRFLSVRGVDLNRFVESLAFINAQEMNSSISIYDNVGTLEAEFESENGCIYINIERGDFSYYDNMLGDSIFWLPNVSIPEVACSNIAGAGKTLNDLIGFGEKNAFLKGCGTILDVENDYNGLIVTLLPNWIELA
ncbi:MAG: hypothetical protein ACR2PC_17605 [Tsuneonella suprasediminis]|nr:hypothetical protein LBX01_12795 [Altererythrobacter sp. N1]